MSKISRLLEETLGRTIFIEVSPNIRIIFIPGLGAGNEKYTYVRTDKHVSPHGQSAKNYY